MTGPRRLPDPPPAVTGDPILRTSAGTPVTAVVTLTNTAPEPRVLAVTAMGVDADWLPRPVRTRPVLPGQSEAIELTIRPAIGAIPARYPMALAVQSLDPVTGEATSQPGLTELTIVLDAPGQVSVSLAPVDTTAVFGKHFQIVLRNAGATPAEVDLQANTPNSTKITLHTPRLQVGPGETVRVGGRIAPQHKRLVGSRTRHTYTITAHSAGAPRHSEGSFTSRAVIGTGPSKLIALVAIVGIWVALAVIFIPKLADRFGPKTTTVAEQKTTTTVAPGSGAPSGGAPGSGAPGSGNGAGNGGGNGGNSSSTSPAAGPGQIALNGTIAGIAPGGVSVNAAPTTFNDALGTGAQPVGTAAADTRPIGKITSDALRAPTPDDAQNTVQVTSNTDGTWAVPPLPKRGFYLLTFAKAGFQTVRYVIDASSASSAKPLAVTLNPGKGGLSGTVSGPGGPLGAATVTITDGHTTTTTTTNSQGTIGTWSIQGLSTPASYLVTASYDGLSTESQLVTLGAAGTASVALTLRTGVVSLSGAVTGTNDGGQIVGLGGATITATSGATTRSVTTLTEAGVAGEYILPDLPAGSYTVTIAANGYTPQTSAITLAQGSSGQTLSAALTPSTAIVSGVICGSDNPVGLAGAGLVLSSPTNTYKTTTTSSASVNTSGTCSAAPTAGAFTFSGVAPGSYVLTSSMFGYNTDAVTIVANGGDRTVVVRSLLKLVGGTLPPTATLTGDAQNAQTLAPLTDLTVPTPGPDPNLHRWGNACGSDGQPDPAVWLTSFKLTAQVTDVVPDPTTPDPNHTKRVTYCTNFLPTEHYTLPDPVLNPGTGLYPGMHVVFITAPGYEPGTARFPVQLATPAQAVSTIAMYPAPKLTGMIGNAATTPPAGPTCVWAVSGTGSIPSPGCVTTGCPAISDPLNTACGSPLSGGNVAATGTYTMVIPRHGNWTVSAVSADTMYNTANYPTSTLALNGTELGFGQGATVTFNFTMHRFSKMTATLYEPGPGNNLQVLTRATSTTPAKVTLVGPNVFCANPPPTTPVAATASVTDSTGAATVDGLAAGWYAVEGGYPSTNPSQTGCASTYVGLDQVMGTSVPLINPIGAFLGRLVYTYNGQLTAAAGVSVTVNGVYDYSGTQGLTRSWTMTTDAQGCFAIHSTQAPQNSGNCTLINGEDPTVTPGTPGTTSQAVGYDPSANLKSSVVTVSTNQPGLLPFTVGPQKQDASVNSFTLTALPVPLTSSGTTNTVSVLPLASAVAGTPVTVTRTSDNTSGGITASLTPDVAMNAQRADLDWHDPSVPANQVVPGTYNLTFSAPGYWAQQATATLTCTVLPSIGCSLSTTPVLKKYATITITAVDSTNAAIDGAVVTLYKGGGTQVQTPQTSAGGAGVSFGTLVPDGTTQYSVGVKAAGYGFVGNPATVNCGGSPTIPLLGPGDTPTCTVTLHRLGVITGTITGIKQLASSIASLPAGNVPVSSPVQGATVTAQLCTATTAVNDPVFNTMTTYCTAVAGPVFPASATTGPDGSFTITGTTAQEGLAPGSYVVTVSSAPGWCLPFPTAIGTCPITAPTGVSPGVVVTVAAADFTGNVPPNTGVVVQVFEQPAKVVFKPTSAGGVAATGLTMTITDPTGYSASPTTAVETLDVSGAGTGVYTFAQVLPGTYTFSGNGDVYAYTTHQQAVTVGGSTAPNSPYPFAINKTNNEVRGSVQGLQGAAAVAGALPGATVTVVVAGANACVTPAAVTGNDNNPLQGPSDPNGNFDFTSVPSNSAGQQYRVCVTMYGYAPGVGTPVTLAGNASTTQNFTLTRITHGVKITVTAPGGTIAAATGATLTAASGTNGPANATLSNLSVAPVSGSPNQVTITAPNVPFGCWTFSLALPSPHFGPLGNPSNVTPTDNGLTCGTGEFQVMGTGTPSTQVTLDYAVNEYQLTINTTATAIAPDPVPNLTLSVGPALAAPTWTHLITSPGSGQADTQMIWVAAGTYTVAAVVPTSDTPNWDVTGASTSVTVGPPSTATATLTLTEIGGGLKVSVARANSTDTVIVSLHCSGAATPVCPGSYDPTYSSTATTFTATFSGIPVSSTLTWTAKATLALQSVTQTVTIAAGAAPTITMPSASTTPTYFPASLTVDAGGTSGAPVTVTICKTSDATGGGTTCPNGSTSDTDAGSGASFSNLAAGTSYLITASRTIAGTPPTVKKDHKTVVPVAGANSATLTPH